MKAAGAPATPRTIPTSPQPAGPGRPGRGPGRRAGLHRDHDRPAAIRGMEIAMEFLDALRRAVAGRRPDEVDRLHDEVERLYQQRRFPAATAVARRLLDLLKGVVGEHHADYATGLNNLAVIV